MTDERIKSGYDKIRSEFMLIVYFAALYRNYGENGIRKPTNTF